MRIGGTLQMRIGGTLQMRIGGTLQMRMGCTLYVRIGGTLQMRMGGTLYMRIYTDPLFFLHIPRESENSLTAINNYTTHTKLFTGTEKGQTFQLALFSIPVKVLL